MQVRNHELTITRGESFTLSKLVQNRDGSPYIISGEFKNPYFLITVSSTIYDQNERYVLNKWLDLKDTKRFKITQPVMLKAINPGYSFSNDAVPNGYEGDRSLGYANVAVFYDTANGVTSYKYWEYINNDEDDFSGKWVDYKCPITTVFGSDITQSLAEQNYMYNISLVDGNSTLQYLKDVADKLRLTTYYGSTLINLSESDSIIEIYDGIYRAKPEFLDGINIEKPIMNVNSMYPILPNTRMLVRSNLNGGSII